MPGKINLIIGCMFSGKTSELMNRYNKYVIAGRKCIIIKHSIDTRYDNICIATHDGKKMNAIACNLLIELDDFIKNYEVICIDEIQFFNDAVLICEKWANEYNKIIEASGLNGDFRRKPFSVISNLIPCCESITFKKAICRTSGKSASFTNRTVESDEQVIIGGDDKYEAVDRTTLLTKKMIFEQHRMKLIDKVIQTMNNFEKVKYFNQTFGILVNENYDSEIFTKSPGVIKYRLDLIQEEISELEQGFNENNFLEVLDAILDILYVTYGMGVTVGINLENEFKLSCCDIMDKDHVNISNFNLIKNMFTQKDETEFTGELDKFNFEAIKSVIEQLRELYNELNYVCQHYQENTNINTNTNQNTVIDILVEIIQFCYYIGFLLRVDVDYAFNLVHEANMTKACVSEDVAKLTVAQYLREKDSYTGSDEYPYQFPSYRVSSDGKYWIVFNDDTRPNPRYAGKILKSINWVEPDLSEFVVKK